MATMLVKPVTRELLAPDPRYGPVLVTLDPGDEISFRYKGKRTTYSVSLHNVHTLALMQFLVVNYRKKLEEYARKKKAGYPHLRKPRPPALQLFNKLYQQALKS